MSNQHPIVPSPKQVDQWFDDAVRLNSTPKYYIATQAAQWGADQELEACINYFHEYDTSWGENSELITGLRTARRPQPPSLKEQALAALHGIHDQGPTGEQVLIIRQALEALPND